MREESLSSSGPSGITERYLYSFVTPQGHGLELMLVEKTGMLVIEFFSVIKALNDFLKTFFAGQLKFRVQSNGSRHAFELLIDSVCLRKKIWYCLEIQHSRAKTFSRSLGHLRVIVDQELMGEFELAFPQVEKTYRRIYFSHFFSRDCFLFSMQLQMTEPYLHCIIGGQMEGEPVMRLRNCWLGHLGAIYFFNDVLPPEQAKVLQLCFLLLYYMAHQSIFVKSSLIDSTFRCCLNADPILLPDN
jgi:hypothetical protein